MKYASVCSGVEAATLAWMPLGWEAAWFSESTGCLYDVIYSNISTQRQKARARSLLKRQEKEEFERVMKKLKGVENE